MSSYTVFPDTEIEVPLADISLNDTEADVILEKGGPIFVAGVISIVFGVIGLFIAGELSTMK